MRLLLTICLLLTACSGVTSEQPAALEADFTTPGVVECRGAHGASVIEVRDAAGLPVAEAHAFGRDVFEVRLDWRAGAVYRIIPDAGEPVTVTAPTSKPMLAVRIHAPLGQNVHEHFIYAGRSSPSPLISVLADPNETIDLLVEIEKLGDQRPLEASLCLGPSKESSKIPRMENVLDNAPVSLRFEFDKQIFQSRVRIGDALPEGSAVVSIEGDGIEFDARLVFAKRDLSADDLTVARWDLPCDEQGLYLSGRAPNQIALPNPVWQKVGAVFNVQTEQISYFEPFVYEQITFENHRENPINLLLKSAAVNPKDGEIVPYFSAPDFLNKGVVKPVMGYCQVPPKAKKSCVMPIFVSPDIEAGTYTRKLEIVPMGTDRSIRTLEGDISVLRSHRLFSVSLVVIVLASLSWLLLIVVFYRRIVTAFGVRGITLLSLLGALKFCLSFGTEMMNQVLYGFLGPFNCLVGGLFSEVVAYLLITSVLFLVPRVGTMTIAYIIAYLIRGVLFGSFGLTDILFTGSTIAYFEICLFLFGVTRFGDMPHRRPRTVPLMLALGIADAASTFTSLTLHSVFYRLFLADWYIVLQVGVTGFLYTLLGVYLGRSLGLSLRKVHL